MDFAICLILTAAVTAVCRDGIRKRANYVYLAATVLAVVSALNLPVRLLEPLTKGSLATALFAVVMLAGAVPGSLRKYWMPIRGELSIAAGILTLGHNVAAGRIHFVQLFTKPGEMPLNYLLAAICSLVMIAILLPLWVTSFPAVRRRMQPKVWKKLQKLAYPFYGLIYLHVLLLNVPGASEGDTAALINVGVFSLVFVGYGILRIGKATGNLLTAGILGAMVLAAVLTLSLPPRTAGEPEGPFVDGTYEGSGRGYRSTIRVQVTVEDEKIAAIEILSQGDDESYWNQALQTVDRVLEYQTTDVDTVTYATKSSRGILKAVRSALKQALPQ